MSNISRLTSLAAAGSGGASYEIAYSSTAGDQLVSFSSGSISQISTINNASTKVLTYSNDGSYLITGSTSLSVYNSSVEGALTAISSIAVNKQIISLDINSAKTRIATGHQGDTSAPMRLFSFNGSSASQIATRRTGTDWIGPATTFNPTGSKIYYGQVNQNGTSTIRATTPDTLPPDTGTSPPYDIYTAQNIRDTGLVFNPVNSSQLAAAVWTSVTSQPNLYILNANGNPNTAGLVGITIGSYNFSGNTAVNTNPNPISWSPDGNYIAYVLGGDIILFDVTNRTAITLVDTFDISVETGVNAIPTGVDFSPDGLYLVVGCRNATIGLVVLDHSTSGSLSLSATYDDTGTVTSPKFKPIVP